MKSAGPLIVLMQSFNRVELLRRALDGLRIIDNEIRASVLIYEAGSTDGSLEIITNFGSIIDIEVVDAPPSLSFSEGFNLLVERARHKYPAAEFLMHYETDNAIKSAAFIPAAFAALESDATIGMLGFSCRAWDGGSVGSAADFPSYLGFALGDNVLGFLRRPQRRPLVGSVAKVDVVYTSPVLIRLEAWSATGGMDASVFPFAECDLDLCWRMNDAGWKVGIFGTDDVIHDNAGLLSNWSRDRRIRWHRARMRLLKRHRGSIPFFLRPALRFRHIIELIVASVLRKPQPQRFMRLLKSVRTDYEF